MLSQPDAFKNLRLDNTSFTALLLLGARDNNGLTHRRPKRKELEAYATLQLLFTRGNNSERAKHQQWQKEIVQELQNIANFQYINRII
jgi:hypothetical protein